MTWETRAFVFALFCFSKNSCPYEQIREKEVCVIIFFFRLPYIDFQVITHNKYLQGMQGVLVTGRRTKLTVSDRVCLKGRNSSHFPQLWSDLFSKPTHEVSSVCGKFFITYIYFFPRSTFVCLLLYVYQICSLAILFLGTGNGCHVDKNEPGFLLKKPHKRCLFCFQKNLR